MAVWEGDAVADAARRPPPVVAGQRKLPHPENDNAAGMTRLKLLLPLTGVTLLLIGALWFLFR